MEIAIFGSIETVTEFHNATKNSDFQFPLTKTLSPMLVVVPRNGRS